MSWTDIFPVLTDEQVADYQQNTTQVEEDMLAEWFSVVRTIQPQSGKHLVATSLFWKNLNPREGELPVITREVMMNAKELGLVSRFAPWDHYVQPLLDGAKILKAGLPDAVFRVYLAADLEFLIPDLVEAGCEIKLMASSSIRHNPGALWRFLALGEQGRCVTITDADRATRILYDVERSEHLLSSGLGYWRAPYMFDCSKMDHPGFYRTTNACHFGAVGGLPVELLMKAFLWHTMRGTMPNECTLVTNGTKGTEITKLPIFGTEWPAYGFDEWLINAVVYPRLAPTGVATFYPINGNAAPPSYWFALDIEYVTWANPKSETFYFGSTDVFTKLRDRKQGRPPTSAVLVELINEKKHSRAADIQSWNPQKRLTLVVARYAEDVSWLHVLPDDITVVLYNKGHEISDPLVLGRVDHLFELPNAGREADTYLHHLETYSHDTDDSWTAFVQGDPFPHNPAFLELLQQRDAWEDVQPLTSYYLNDGHTPPRELQIMEDREWIRGIPIRTEMASARSLGNLNWHDGEGAYRYFKDYREHFGIPHGWSLTGHFVEACGLTELAKKAWKAVLVRYAYAGIFAVRNERLSKIPKECVPQMRKLACEHYFGAYMYERMWLHLFGLPFLDEAAVGEAEGRLEKDLAAF